jgi:hypothetical protein
MWMRNFYNRVGIAVIFTFIIEDFEGLVDEENKNSFEHGSL